MKVPLVSIKIDNRQAAHVPGETLSGEYQIDAVEAAELDAIELSVLWYSEGKGDEDLGVHHFERRTDEDEDPTPLTELRKFSVTLPNSPLSYEGVLIKLRWCVRVRVFLKSGRNHFAELPFRLGTAPEGRLVAPPLETVEEPSPAAVTDGAARGGVD
ncbi:MAG: hypothetical protein WD894_01160 [Pirellulales bacterium]